MIQNFIMWMQEPGKWNDAAVLCGVFTIVCFVAVIVGEKIEKRKAWKRGEM